MNIEEFREYCLSLEGVTEKIPFGKFARKFESTLVFYVLDHMFCLVDMDDFTEVTFRSTTDEITEISGRYDCVHRPVNPALKLWVSVSLNQDMPDHEIFRFVGQAYEIIKNKYEKKKG
ncbi:MAG: MmcQ/YjbR family DNA-binding protein [Duncaniella sp.]|nr:MmcQ/YjbR family DNA-binding protein [Duncaniella sp.]